MWRIRRIPGTPTAVTSRCAVREDVEVEIQRVDPAAVIDRYGVDTARMFILFKAPPEKDLADDADVEGQFRFLQRLGALLKV